MTHWRGRWLMATATLHLLACVALAHPALAALWRRGLVGAMGADAATDAALWSLLFGSALGLLGMALAALEKARTPLPPALGWGLLALGVAGAALLPASGFWLALPPAVAIVRRRGRVS